MQKILFVDPEKCRGCRLCEAVCSLFHEKVINPSRARIHVIKYENDEFYVPVTIKCDFCSGDPNCVKFCIPGSLQFIEANAINLKKKREAIENFSKIIDKYMKNMRISVAKK